MLKDISMMNPKGHVKLELYNDGGVFYKKEKKNLTVQNANKIVANMMADPAKVVRISKTDKGDSALSANAELLYPFALSVKKEAKVKFENNYGAVNTQTEFEIEELKHLISLDHVQVGETELVVDRDVFVLDAEKGKIKFQTAPTEAVVIRAHKLNNPYMGIIAGTESVKVKGEAWTRSDVPNSEKKQYAFDHRTGEVLFNESQIKVEVSYDYNMNYALGFMGLGGKPSANWENYKPVEFGNSNKLDPDMQNEFDGSRMPVQFPASISEGATELEPSIPTQPVLTVLKQNVAVKIQDKGDGSALLKYELGNKHDSGSGLQGRLLHQLLTVKNVTKSTEIDVKNVKVSVNTLNKVEIEFNASDVAIGDELLIDYRLKLNDSHLIYQLGQTPSIELVSVQHTDAVTQEVKAYNIVQQGLNPNQGDVWISNPSTGHITFSSVPSNGVPVETPGQLTIEYKVNSGTVVKFVADFPKGVPAPTIETVSKNITAVSGQSSVSLDYEIAKDATGAFYEPVIKLINNGSTTTLQPGSYSISLDGRTVSITGLTAGVIVAIEYKYEKSTHDIYQVAMFDNIAGGTMFNISGIGPVTKDKNTGMRISWSITF